MDADAAASSSVLDAAEGFDPDAQSVLLHVLEVPPAEVDEVLRLEAPRLAAVPPLALPDRDGGLQGVDPEPGGLERRPFRDIVKRWDGDALAPVEPGQRGIDEIAHLHHILQCVHIDTGMLPDLGACRRGQHGLHIDALRRQLQRQRLREVQHKGLGRPIDGGAEFRRQPHDRPDVDDRPFARSRHPGRGRAGKARQRAAVQRDQPLDLVAGLRHEGAAKAGAGIVHQNADPRIVPQSRFHRRALPAVRKVGGQDVDGNARLVAQLVRQRRQSVLVARHQHQIMPATRQAIRIGGADPAGGAGDEDGRFSAHGLLFPQLEHI